MTLRNALAEALDPVILALDTGDPAQARAWLEAMPALRRVKVGLELFLAAGFPFVEQLRAEGYWVFLDLKLHDIPNTVGRAMREVAAREVELATVHALGGPRMIEAARAAAGAGTRIVAVTALTAHDAGEWRELGFADDIADSARRLARQAVDAGADGVVCSPLEVSVLRHDLGPEALLVTPGIRLADQQAGDQRRIATPGGAARDGADLLVIGRPLTGAEAPAAVLERIADDLASSRAGD